MAINRPPITDDKAVNAWFYEITQELDRIDNVEQQVEQTINFGGAAPILSHQIYISDPSPSTTIWSFNMEPGHSVKWSIIPNNFPPPHSDPNAYRNLVGVDNIFVGTTRVAELPRNLQITRGTASNYLWGFHHNDTANLQVLQLRLDPNGPLIAYEITHYGIP